VGRIAKEGLLRIDQNAALAAEAAQQNSDVVRGAKGIAQTLGLPQRAVEHMLARGYLKTPRRIGHSWYASRQRLLKELIG
jgi:hypothetical protein